MLTGLILFLLSLSETIQWWALFVSIVAGVLFYRIEKRTQNPFMDIAALQRNKYVNLVYIIFLFINVVFYNFVIGFPSFLQQVRGYSEEMTGLIMLTIAASSVVITPIAGKLIDKRGSKLTMIFGTTLGAIATIALYTYTGATHLITFLLILIFLGMSSGLSKLSAQTALFEHVAEKDTGSASGLFQTSRYVGAILSGSFLGVAFTGTLNDTNLRVVITISLIVAIVNVFLAFKLPNKKLP